MNVTITNQSIRVVFTRPSIIIGGSSSLEWGNITGTLSDQTDLQTELDAKLNIADIPKVQIDQAGGTSDTYGVLTGAVNGVNTDYTVSQGVYTTGKLKVYLNGQLQTQGTSEDWIELLPNSGTLRFNTPPQTGDIITAEYDRTVGSGNGITYIRNRSDLPAAVSGVITLASGAYIVTDHVDLLGDRIVFSGIATLLGTSSENASLTSTGLSSANPLIYTEYTLPIQNISITADNAIEINGDGIRDVAIDWYAVNFVNCPTVGVVRNATNFIYGTSAFLNSANLTFDGTIGTIGINNSLLTGLAGQTTLTLAPTLTITRRFRAIYSSFVVFGGGTAINADVSATVPTESFILDTINFSGGATYVSGITVGDNRALFTRCTGIVNTAVNGQMYMNANATATTISNTIDFFKVAGTTTPSADNNKYLHSSNRLTCDAIISRKYLIQCSLSFNSGNSNVCEFGIFDSELNAVRTPSRTRSTANAAGRAENVTFFCVVEHKQGDYIEIHARNTSASTNITVSDMNVLITEIN